MIDLYRAVGGEVSEDGQSVTVRADQPVKPFRIVADAFLEGVEYLDGLETATLRLPVHREYTYGPGTVLDHEPGDQIVTFPVAQIPYADEVTDAMVEAFKEAWHSADRAGEVGGRVRAGLAAALRAQVTP